MNYPNLATPQQSARDLARRAGNDARLHIQQRIRDVSHKMLNVAEQTLDILARPRAPALARDDERRQYANMLRAAEFCAHGRCRRTHSCQGDPRDCLRVLLPAIGLDKAVALIAQRPRSAGRRRRPSP